MFSMSVISLQSVRLLQQILWDELISLCMHFSHIKKNFSKRTKGTDHKGISPRPLFFYTIFISIKIYTKYDIFHKLFIKIRAEQKTAIRRDGNPPTKPSFLNLVYFNQISWKYWNRAKEWDAKMLWNATKILSENNNRCSVNDFKFACSLILFYLFIFFLFLSKSSSDVIICTG